MRIYTFRYKVHFTKLFFRGSYWVFLQRFSFPGHIAVWFGQRGFHLNFVYSEFYFPLCFLFATLKQKIFVCPLIPWALLHTTSFIAVFQSLCLSSACLLTLYLFLWLMIGFIVAIKVFLDSRFFFFLFLLFSPSFHLQQDRSAFKAATATVTTGSSDSSKTSQTSQFDPLLIKKTY